MGRWQDNVNVMNVNIVYGKVFGDGGDPVEVEDGIYPTPVAVAVTLVDEYETGKMQFDWTDSDNAPEIVESYSIYIWSSGLQEGQHFYLDNDGTQGPYHIQSDVVLTPGDYEVTIEAEAYGDGVGNSPVDPAVMTGSPLTINPVVIATIAKTPNKVTVKEDTDTV